MNVKAEPQYSRDTTIQIDTPGSDIQTVNRRPDNLNEYVKQFHDGGGYYNLPDGSRVYTKKAAISVLRSYFREREEGDEGPQYICIQHPDMAVYGPVYERDEDGEIKTDHRDNRVRVKYKQLVRGREKWYDETMKYGEFVGGQFVPAPGLSVEDEVVQEVLDATNYVIKE